MFGIRKKVKIMDKPKLPMSAYMLWLNSTREQIKADNPGLKVTEIAKMGGEIWRSMKDKSLWEEKAAKAKEQYIKDLESYNANGGGGDEEEEESKMFGIRKKVKMMDKPKPPMSAYMLWLNSTREQIKADNPGLKVTEIAKMGGEIWRSMKDKSLWEEKAAKAKEQYIKDLESYNANGGGGDEEEEESKMFDIRKKVKMMDKPKPPMSAYMLWLNSTREQIKADNPGLKVTEIAKMGGEIWRLMKDKSLWEEKAAKAKEQYIKDLESYNANGGGGDEGREEESE